MGLYNLGDQQITVHYLQELQSITANQQLLGILEPGVLTLNLNPSEAVTKMDGNSLSFELLKDTSIAFGGSVLENGLVTRKFVTKVSFASNTGTILIPFATESQYSTYSTLHVFAIWAYSQDLNQRFVSFEISTSPSEVLYHNSSEGQSSKIRLFSIRKAVGSNWTAAPIKIWTDNVTNLNGYKSINDGMNQFKLSVIDDSKALVLVTGSAFLDGRMVLVSETPTLESLKGKNLLTISNDTSNGLIEFEKWVRQAPEMSGLLAGENQIDLLILRTSLIEETGSYKLAWHSIKTSSSITQGNWKTVLSNNRFDTIDKDCIILGVFWRTKILGMSLSDVFSPETSVFWDNRNLYIVKGLFSKDLTIPIYEE